VPTAWSLRNLDPRRASPGLPLRRCYTSAMRGLVALSVVAAGQLACSSTMAVDDTAVLPDGGDATVSDSASDSAYPSCDGGCPANSACAYPVADGCNAQGVCVPVAPCLGAGKQPVYCGCLGTGVVQRCGIPAGYTPAPVQMPVLGASFPCTHSDAGDASVTSDAGDPGSDAGTEASGPARCVAAGGRCVAGAAFCANVAPHATPKDCDPSPGGTVCCAVDDDAGCTEIRAAKYDQSCTMDSDCVQVGVGNACYVCTPRCDRSGAINARALGQYMADFDKTPAGAVMCSCAVNNWTPTCCLSGQCHVGNECVPLDGSTDAAGAHAE
jgi:hypothetical protein